MGRFSEKKIFILLLCFIAALAYFGFDWHKRAVEKTALEETKKEQEKWLSIVNKLKADIAALERNAEEEKAAASESRVPESSAPEPPLFIEKEKLDCNELKKNLSAVFEYLNGREYIQALRLKNGSQEYYNKIMNKLSQNPPLTSEVMLDFDTLLKNILHFYHVLGKDNILIIKEMLNNEGENLETIMSVFYEYFTSGEECRNDDLFIPSAVTRYEYAGFFLNTLGGKSYLFRRDSNLRILTTYYAVLALHEANEKIINRQGIDLRPQLEQIREEITARNDLAFQKNYLETLSAIRDEYPSARENRE